MLLHMAISAAVAAFGKDGGRQAREALNKMIEGLQNGP